MMLINVCNRQTHIDSEKNATHLEHTALCISGATLKKRYCNWDPPVPVVTAHVDDLCGMGFKRRDNLELHDQSGANFAER